MSRSAATKGPDPADAGFMRAALVLARRGLGQVSPNPAVGCVLVKGGRIVGRGWTQPGGRPHAETEALARAGRSARDATAYVTLEPCAHQGKTPPCAEALIEAGIARCVVALVDPDPRVGGRGLEALRQAGVEVEEACLSEAAAEVLAGYLQRVQAGRPLVNLKLATTLDGRIATRGGQSRWITGPVARARGHLLRASSDAVMIGGATAAQDNPRLDVRLPGLEARSPLRVVLDGRLRLPLTHDLVTRAQQQPTCLLTRSGNDPERLRAYRAAGVDLIEVADNVEGGLCLEAALQVLGKRGLNDLLVEGGGRLAAGLLRGGLVDRLVWFRAPSVIGGDGVPAAAGFGLDDLEAAPGFELASVARAGKDSVETYRRVP